MVAVPDEANHPLLPGCAYSDNAGSVSQELINQFSHDHLWYWFDDNTVCSLLDEAIQDTTYVTTIKPYAHCKDGQTPLFAIIIPHAGVDKWGKI